MAITRPFPASVRTATALESPNLWERVVHVLLRAQNGEFGSALALLDVIEQSADSHLRDCAIRVFALTAPSTELEQLGRVFEHPDYDTRGEAYVAASLTGDLRLAQALVEDEEELANSGGTIAALFELLEGMTGISYAGCLDDDCAPVLPKISFTLNTITQSGILDILEPGHRYFFGRRVP